MMTMALTPLMSNYVRKAAETVRRWDTSLMVPADADDARAATMIRSAFLRAAQKVAAYDGGSPYNDDHSWMLTGMRGVTRDRVRDEVAISRDRMAPAPEEWGIMARVTCGDAFFDVPIAMDLDESAARNVLARMEGSEPRWVDVDMVARALAGEPFEIMLHADNWGKLREIALDGILTMDEAMDFRRPVVWDLMRASLAELPPEPLHPFSEEEFYTRHARSTRFDASLMNSTREMAEPLARIEAEALSISWGEWFPAMVDLLNSMGVAKPMDGISIILNFAVEEPVAGLPVDGDGDPVDLWSPVGYHNLIVCYGLHPLSAGPVLELVRRNPTEFYDLPPGEERRHVLVGASAIQDTMLSQMRVSMHGRTDAYDRIAAMPLSRD